jgi:plastocyanin
MIRSMARRAMVAGIVGAIALSACSDDDESADSTSVSAQSGGSTVTEAPSTNTEAANTEPTDTDAPSTDAPSTDTDAVPEATTAPTQPADVVATEPPTGGEGTTAPPAEDAALTISNSSFSSATATAGVEFTIVNEDGFGHTVTNRDAIFDVTVSGSSSATLTIERPGEYEIFCRIHDSMTGTITVV